jgi:hypothetical protein
LAFYGALSGWVDEANEIGPGMYYHMQMLNGLEVAALYQQSEEKSNSEFRPIGRSSSLLMTSRKIESPINYTMLNVGGTDLAGVIQITEEMKPMPPAWMVYFGVNDVDTAQIRLYHWAVQYSSHLQTYRTSVGSLD